MDILRNIFKFLYFIYILIIIVMYTKVPDGNWDSYKNVDNIIMQNLDHFILFFLLGSIAMFISKKLSIYNNYVVSAVLISTLIEFIHLFLSYREFEFIDILFNMTGCLFGIMSLYYVRRKVWKNY